MKLETWVDWNSKVTTSNYVSTSTTATWAVWNKQCKHLVEQTIRHSLSTTGHTWVKWNAASWGMVNETTRGVITTREMPETLEQVARRRQYETEANARQRASQDAIIRERAEAKEKAEKLLQSALSSEQREELNNKGFFHCKSRVGNRYRIYRGSHGNVKLLNPSGKEIEKLCVQPSYVPEGDCMLAQKLHIEHNEDDFRRTANITTIH